MVAIGTEVSFKGDNGVVRYAGETQFAPGVWVGVELELPNGKNDGSVKGERYFTCQENHGIFVREHLLELLEDKVHVKKTRGSLPIDTPTRRSSTRLSSAVSSRAPSRASDGGLHDPGTESIRLRNIIQKLQDKLQVMKSDIDILRSQLHLVEAKNVELEEALIKNKEEVEISAIDKETLEEHNVLLKEEIESLREQNSKIREQIKSLDQETKSPSNSGNQKLLNETKESLIKRNSMLEDALVKLRDHSIEQKTTLQRKIDDLESKLDPLLDIEVKYEETSITLIDAETTIADLKSYIETSIHSTEIIDTLTNENNSLTEENEKLKSTVQELEELRRVGEELENFHVDHTTNLQKEIEKLKEQFEKQTIGVKDLEATHDALKVKTRELEKINESLKQQTNGTTIKSIEPNNNISSLQKQRYQLESDLSFTELQYKEQYITFLEGICGRSDTTTQYKQVLQLKTFTENYEQLSSFLVTDASDLFINVLSIKLKYELLVFKEALELLSSRHQYSQSFISLELNQLMTVTQSITEQVKEQDYRNLPNFGELEQSLFAQISNSTCSFPNYFDFKYNINKELKGVDSLLIIIGLLSDDETANRFSIPRGTLSKLFQASNERKKQLESVLDKLKISEGEHIEEINKIEVIGLQDQFESFLKLLSEILVTNDDVSLDQDINLLLEFISNHLNDQFNIEFINTEQSWFLKDPQNKPIGTKEFSLLELDLSTAKELSIQKDKQIEELMLKINVLSSRLNINKATEADLRNLKDEVKNLNEMNEELNERVLNLTNSNQEMSKDLQKAKTNSLLYNSNFESLYEQKQYTEKSQLISELHTLRNVVKTLTKKQTTNRNWLRVELPKFKNYEKSKADELRMIGKDLQRAVNNSKIYSAAK